MKLEKKQRNSGTKKNPWDKPFTPYQRKNVENNRQGQGSNSTKIKDETSQSQSKSKNPRISKQERRDPIITKDRTLGFATSATKKGHLSNQCPQRKTIAYVEEEESQGDKTTPNSKEDVNELAPERGGATFLHNSTNSTHTKDRDSPTKTLIILNTLHKQWQSLQHHNW